MQRVYFCKECKRVFMKEDKCGCEIENGVKEIKLGTPVNIIGTKLKGKVRRIKGDKLELLITSSPNRYLKEFRMDEVRKIL
ncbi:hypothetical protein CS063_08660 [Sporanaerobium hydrogeniformans]|uniref:Uncharacterized protein n=1 Tax=Sporanaerobium hydrogeniformans TaxID=3072179 RepID=A0AC61DCZ6_9FIRM|nr:hypothetical protein [Sporanaerobium hydrogeniformans]PHV70827.1 hypothetical protein CS063_08660 [Sporanaerobium hydrogeniformans]